jgi:hypothetical protein
MKFIFVLLFSIVSIASLSQVIATDTLYPYALKKSEENNNEYRVLFSNSNLYFTGRENAVKEVLEKAIRKTDPLLISYNSETYEIVSTATLGLSKLEKFLDIYDSLSFGTFTFNKDKSFQKNVRRLEDAVERTNKNYRRETTTDSIAFYFNYFNAMSCEKVERCDAQNRCIPYDYKINGCNARAHWMKKLLNEQFNLDCKKIFSEGNLIANNNSNCGKKCVFWGWHVAIALYAKDVQGNLQEYILDPSLFNKPVTRQEWIDAQTFTCPSTGRKGVVQEVYVKDSHIYTPNGSTDPYYISTQNLIAKFCKQCH